MQPIDLHVHIRGTIDIPTARMLAGKNNIPFPEEAIKSEKSYNWSDFSSFLKVYHEIGSVIKTPEDLQLVAENYLKKCAEENVLYVEFMHSPDHLIDFGLSYVDQIQAIASASQKIKAKTGIESRLIITCVRHKGPDVALNLAKLASKQPNSIVVGFGMTGDERQYQAREFEPAFNAARATGLKLTAHSGEFREAAAIQETISFLKPHRIGHGVNAIYDNNVVARLRDEKIGLEICLSSNIGLKLFSSFGTHPFSLLRNEGCLATLATDDPAYFDTSPRREYEIAHKAFSLSELDLRNISKTAIEVSFCDEKTKAILQSKLS